MSGEDEDESQGDHFHLVYRFVLENFSELRTLSGEHHVACLGITVIYLSLRADFVCETLTCQNQSLTQVVWVSRFAR